MTEDEMVGWHHRLNGHEFEQAPRDGEGQGGWCAAVHGVAKSRTRLSHWTTRPCHTLVLISSPALDHYYKTPANPLPGQNFHTVLRALACCVPLCLAKQ